MPVKEAGSARGAPGTAASAIAAGVVSRYDSSKGRIIYRLPIRIRSVPKTRRILKAEGGHIYTYSEI